jgi:methylated-DNA-[protein]-cysteine S-methyltransferase
MMSTSARTIRPDVPRELLYTSVESPIGELLLLGDGQVLSGLYMQGGRKPIAIGPRWRCSSAAFGQVQAQLLQYFAGERAAFDVSVTMRGDPFERLVWRALRDIPYGETVSYGEVARRIGHPSAARAVGLANARNPIAIIVPCHRVIGADGTLTGYAGGLERKRALLELEAGQARLPI